MSRRIVWLAAVWLLAPSRAQAQTEPQEPRTATELAEHIEELMPRLEASRFAMEAALERQRAEESRETHPQVDTVTIGPLRVVTPPEQSELAARLFGEVWRDDFAGVGGSPALERRLFTFQWSVSPQHIYVSETDGTVASRLMLSRLRYRTEQSVKDRIRFEIAYALVDDFDRLRSPIARWLTGVHADDLDPTVAYRQLARAASLGGPFQGCLSGDLDACWTMDGLDEPDPFASLTDAFSEDEQRAIVERVFPLLPVSSQRLVEQAGGTTKMLECIQQKSDAVCAGMLDTELDGYLHLLLRDGRNALRWTLFFHAVDLGGEGAWDRALATADAPPGQVLTEVSGMDRRALIASWRDTVETGRPAQATFGGARWTVLVWVLIFLAFASRSTRWRLG